MFGGFLLNLAVAIFGLYSILQFSWGWFGVGIIALLIGGFNVRSQFNRPWWVTVKVSDGEELRIQKESKEEIDRLYAALREAMERT